MFLVRKWVRSGTFSARYGVSGFCVIPNELVSVFLFFLSGHFAVVVS